MQEVVQYINPDDVPMLTSFYSVKFLNPCSVNYSPFNFVMSGNRCNAEASLRG